MFVYLSICQFQFFHILATVNNTMNMDVQMAIQVLAYDSWVYADRVKLLGPVIIPHLIF